MTQTGNGLFMPSWENPDRTSEPDTTLTDCTPQHTRRGAPGPMFYKKLG